MKKSLFKDLIFKNLLLSFVSNDVGQQLQLETSQTTMHACASGHSAASAGLSANIGQVVAPKK